MSRTIILMMLSIMLIPSTMRSQELYVGSYNIRYRNDGDTKKGTDGNSVVLWSVVS